MKRILTYQIEENTTIEKFLKAKLGFSRKQISALKFREDGIRVNGKRRRVTERLLPGDLLELSVEEEGKSSSQLIPTEGTISVLYEDEDLIVVNKPEGILVHPSGGHYQDTLANLLMGYFKKKGEVPVLRSIGRIRTPPGPCFLPRRNWRRPGFRRNGSGGGMRRNIWQWRKGILRKRLGRFTFPSARCRGAVRFGWK